MQALTFGDCTFKNPLHAQLFNITSEKERWKRTDQYVGDVDVRGTTRSPDDLVGATMRSFVKIVEACSERGKRAYISFATRG